MLIEHVFGLTWANAASIMRTALSCLNPVSVFDKFFGHIRSLCYLSQFNLTVFERHFVNFSDVIVCDCKRSRTVIVSQAGPVTFKFGCSKFHCCKWSCRVSGHRVQLFDLRRYIIFQKNIFIDNFLLDFSHFHKNTLPAHLNDCQIATALPK